MVSPGGLLAGNGSPEGSVIGNPGQRYRDLDNDNLYMKLHGTQNAGWELVGKFGDAGVDGAAGAGGSVLYMSTDPTGVLSVTGPAVCVGTGAMTGSVWEKTTAGTSADEWILLISV
jgi:hypothetical protein